MELWKYYRILYRRKWLIIVGMLICVGAAFFIASQQKATYTAVARVMERQPNYSGSNVFVEGVFTGIDPQLRLSNLARVAASRTVAVRVKEELGRRGVALDVDELLKNTQVYPERDTQLLRISVTDPDAQVAMEAANQVAIEFGDFYRELIYGPAKQREYIQGQVQIAKNTLEQARTALEQYKAQTGLNNLDIDVQNKLARLSEMDSQLKSAEVLAQESANRLAATKKEFATLPKRRQEQMTTGESQLWLTLTSALNQQEQSLASMMAHRGRAHPEVAALEKSIDDIKKKLVNEQRQRLLQSVDAINPVYSGTQERLIQSQVDAIGTRARASALRLVVPSMKSELANYPQNEKKLADLTYEAKVAENTYGLLRQKLDEAKIRESEPYATGTIKMVDEAMPEQVATSKKLKVALALPLSILLSCAIIFLLDYLDNTIRTPEEAEELLGLPVATMVPLGRGHSLVRGLPDPGLRESYQMLSASLWYEKAKQSGSGAIMVASAEPNSGRTVTAGNLAAALAADGARVILVDADLRQPAQHLVFGVENLKGFSNVLAGAAALEDVAVPTKTEGLLLVPSGPLPENPVRLLHSDAVSRFLEDALSVADFVVFDTPAGAAFADATLLAAHVKRVMLVQSAGRVPRGAEAEFKARLEQVGVEFLGVVLNKVRPDDSHGVYHFRTAYAGLPPGGNPPAGTVSPTSPAIPG